ncbi:MAG TPA: FAD-binding oxidoreductase, partial [Steroidobacteraceae bacterium]|nr:FAD-binding oxidoreductase [Steroidobacteraceae bacterium]
MKKGTPTRTTDVLIAGGGVIGSATAYFLLQQPGWRGRVAVIEPDPSYRYAASALSASSIRQQFSSPINIRMSQFGIEFLRDLEAGRLADGQPASIGLVESSYLYLASETGLESLQENVAIQRQCGVDVTLRTRMGLQNRYPWLATSDLAGGADTVGCEGWFDGYALLKELRRRAEALGASYLRDRVRSIDARAGRVRSLQLEGGSQWECGTLVNATGTASSELAAQLGIDLPVRARKRCVFVFQCAEAVEGCPLVIDPSGLWFRPERDRFICGLPSEPDPEVALDDFDVPSELFDTVVWPRLADRVPAFEAIRMTGAWAGHYDYNVFDQNAFVGPAPGVENFLLASGFSGHG